MATTDETADQVAKAKLALEAAESEHAAAIATAAENLSAEELVTELLDELVMRAGNRPAMRALLTRIKAKVAPPAAAPAPAAATIAS